MRDQQTSRFSIEPILDSIVHNQHKPKPAQVLYHYTDWVAAKGIITHQHIWETAHDCVNDDHELQAAHEVILDEAHKLLMKSRGTAYRALYHFIQAYERLKISNMKTIYMACFSIARDDLYQWKHYAADGRGLCLGIRVLDEQAPISSIMGSALLKIDYFQPSWEKHIRTAFSKICSQLSRTNCTSANIEEGMAAFYRIAAFTAISAKKPKWAPEREFRHVTIIRDGVDFTPKTRIRDGKEIRYLDEVTLREHRQLLAFAEIIIGPNQDSTTARNELAEILKAAGYTPNMMEYPAITVSELSAWQSKA